MAKKKKGPRQIVGLQCTVCKHFNYVTQYNKNSELLRKQTAGTSAFPIKKYCKYCKQHRDHKLMKKLK